MTDCDQHISDDNITIIFQSWINIYDNIDDDDNTTKIIQTLTMNDPDDCDA